MNSRETELIREIGLGNLKAFDEIFKSFYGPLCIYAADIINNRNYAEEIVQDVFLKFWLNRASIHITTSVKSYLYRMVHNHTLNFIRDYGLNREKEEVSFDDLNNRSKLLEIKTSYDVLDELLLQQMEEELSAAISNLPPQCNQIFRMARYQGMTYAEIAEELKISVSTVKSQMLRAIEKLKTTLDEHLK